MMKQYDSYKDSGVEWIGKIPSHWEVCRFKDFASLRTDASDDDNKIGLENIEGKTGRFIETSTEFQGNGTAFQEGDIVYGKLRPYLQKVWLATFDGNAVGDFFVFRAKENCRNKLLFYIMISDGFTCMCNGATFGAKMPRVSSDFIRGMHLYLPPMVEQDAMISYLDKKCGEIDKAITTQEKRVELLKELRQNIITQAVTRGINPDAHLKDSGVEWIGEVPEYWEVMKTSLIYSNIGSGTTPSTSNPSYYTEENDGFYWLQTGDLNDGEINDTSKKITDLAVKECKLKFYPVDSVVIAMYGATIGKVGLLKVETATNQACCVLPHSNKMTPYFSFYLYQSAKTPMLLEAMGGGQPNISQDIIKKLRVPVPPLSEQQEIVSYIESQTARLDKSIEKAEHQIELLQELKQSIITEVVTGKRKVD